eukprot:9657-Heterococcus_DN1.PRE.3
MHAHSVALTAVTEQRLLTAYWLAVCPVQVQCDTWYQLNASTIFQTEWTERASVVTVQNTRQSGHSALQYY